MECGFNLVCEMGDGAVNVVRGIEDGISDELVRHFRFERSPIGDGFGLWGGGGEGVSL